MKVEIISIGTRLLMSDILDTNTAYISRTLRDVNLTLTCKVTVGDDPEMIADVLQVALKRADLILTTGDLDGEVGSHIRQAVAGVTGRELITEAPGIMGATQLGRAGANTSGLLIEESDKIIACLPGNRREVAYVLETEVLPYMQQRFSEYSKAGWILLRTVDIMESSLKQQLADLALTSNHRVRYDSYAGQTNIQLWVEAESEKQIQQELPVQ